MATILERPVAENAEPEVARPGSSPRFGIIALVVSVVVLTVIALVLALPGLISPKHVYDPNSATTKTFEFQTGIHLVRVAPTGDSGLVEITYQIVNTTSAANLLGPSHDVYPTLIDEASGTPIAEAFMGHAPHPTMRVGEQHFAILMDPGHIVRGGGLVTVVIGSYRLQHVPVSGE